MKKILVVLFALLSAQAFGQAYSATVLQNSAGNYGRPVPYPQVLVCVPGDTNVPCISRATTYFDDTLTTQCTQTGSSGLLIGNPTSGPNCNNPGIGDVNGNFTIYVAGGEYMICTYSGTWLCQKQTIGNGGSSGPGGLINSCIGSSCDAYFPVANVPSIFGDPLATDDGAGNKTGKTFTTTQTGIAGFHYFTQGTQPLFTVNNSAYIFAPTSVPSSLGFKLLATLPGNGNCAQFGVSGLTWTLNDSGSPCGTGSGPTVPQALNPVAPTLTTNGSAGSTSYSYVVVGCEDGPTCADHSAATSVATIGTGNATLTSSNSINLKTYADTLYGYRCYNIYRTASGGTPSSTGLIANCVWKTFIDTGLAGNSATAPNTNTTALDPNGLTTPLPGCNKIPSAPYGIDGVPCAPNAYDDEFTDTFQIAGINSPEWTTLNPGSATFTLTSGELSIDSPANASTNAEHCVKKPVPSTTPYTVRAAFYLNGSGGTGSSAQTWAGFGFYESASGKLETVELFATNTVQVARWNSTSSFSTSPTNAAAAISGFMYVDIQNDGTHLNFSTSLDGIHPVRIWQDVTLSTWFTTAPDNIVLCVNPQNTEGVNDTDYVRRTQ